MRRFTPHFLILLVIALTGCSDVVTTRFATLAEAKLQHAFDRGWLPPIMPDSARNIIERNNLDSNSGTGSFDYNLPERTAYLERLIRSGASLRSGSEIDVLLVTTDDSHWEIQLPRSQGEARWKMRPAARR